MQKAILITWWTGYIGAHAVVQFEQAWYKTIILDNLSNSSLDTLKWIENILGYTVPFYQTDIRDAISLAEIFQKNTIHGVIHFAGLKSVGESCDNAWLYFDNNIAGTITLCNEMQKHWVKDIIFSSSCTVYWDPKYVPIDEKHQLWETSNPYWKTKQLLEKILEDYSKFSWFNVINLRYFNPIWWHTSGEIWENPQKIPPNLLPYIFKVASWDLPVLNIFWNNRPTPDGTCIRDYINVNDLVSGHLKAYKYLTELSTTKFWKLDIFNLWTWKWVSVLEMLNAVKSVSWKDIPHKITNRRIWDLWEIYWNADKAKQKLWRTAKTSLEDSIKQMMKFYFLPKSITWKTK